MNLWSPIWIQPLGVTLVFFCSQRVINNYKAADHRVQPPKLWLSTAPSWLIFILRQFTRDSFTHDPRKLNTPYKFLGIYIFFFFFFFGSCALVSRVFEDSLSQYDLTLLSCSNVKPCPGLGLSSDFITDGLRAKRVLCFVTSRDNKEGKRCRVICSLLISRNSSYSTFQYKKSRLMVLLFSTTGGYFLLFSRLMVKVHLTPKYFFC